MVIGEYDCSSLGDFIMCFAQILDHPVISRHL